MYKVYKMHDLTVIKPQPFYEKQNKAIEFCFKFKTIGFFFSAVLVPMINKKYKQRSTTAV